MRIAPPLLTLASALTLASCGGGGGGSGGETDGGGTATAGSTSGTGTGTSSTTGTGTTGTGTTGPGTTAGTTGTGTTAGTTAGTAGSGTTAGTAGSGSDTGTGTAGASTGGSTGGSMCAPGFLECGGGCVNPDNDVAHCGGCGNFCGPGFAWFCNQGACVDYRAWTAPAPLTDGAANARYPVPQADATGDAAVVWLEAGSAKAAAYDGTFESWAAPVPVGTAATPPSFGMDAATGAAFGAWTNDSIDDVRGAFYDGASWGLELSNLGAVSPFPAPFPTRVAVDGDKSVLVWLGGAGGPTDRLLGRIHDGMAWGAEVALDWAQDATWGVVPPSNSFDLAIAPGTGFAIAVWIQERKDTNSFVLSANDFGGPEVIADMSGYAISPDIGIDGANRAIVVWQQAWVPNGNAIYAKRYEGGWSAETALATEPAKLLDRPRIAVNAAGDAMVVFMRKEANGATLWARRYDPATDTWAPSELVEQIQDPTFVEWQLALDAAGNAVVVWSWGNPVDAYARHYAAVANAWDAVVTLENNPGTARNMDVTADGQGNFLVVWSQPDLASEQIFAAWYR